MFESVTDVVNLMLVQVEADQAGDLPPVPGEELLAQAVPQAGTPPCRDQGIVHTEC